MHYIYQNMNIYNEISVEKINGKEIIYRVIHAKVLLKINLFVYEI